MKRWITMLLVLSLLCSSITVSAANDTGVGYGDSTGSTAVQMSKERAMQWLLKSRNENGSYGEDTLPIDTTQVLKLLRDEGCAEESSWISGQAKQWVTDNDSAARFYCATGEIKYLDVLEGPNDDGGYGLTGDYESDSFDTILVLEALMRKHLQDGEETEQIQKTLDYLKNIQNADGGFSYLQKEDGKSDRGLSLRIALITTSCEKVADITVPESLRTKLDTYIMSNAEGFSASFEEDAYLKLYMCMQKKVVSTAEIVQELETKQNMDGSFGKGLDDTIAAIRLLNGIEEFNKPRLDVRGMTTELSTYSVYPGYDTKVQVSSAITYECNRMFEGIWKIEVFSGDNVTKTRELKAVFTAGENYLNLNETVIISAVSEEVYKIRTTLLMDGEILFSNEEELYPKELTIEELVLEAECCEEGVHLSWNDINNDVFRYGYRIYRSTDRKEWETKSSWNGEETVKVLNIYPHYIVQNTLKAWMEENIFAEGEPAGKGIIQVDSVYIDAYNLQPEEYLLDEEGNYKYDVLYFGASDSNTYKDITETSYLATQKFVDAGRGVLFGHDTICLGTGAEHPYFNRFADQLGVKLKAQSGYILGNQVKVVNSGLLTSYPWKVQGVLNIPTSHTYQQYTGGTTKATVWMKYTAGGYADAESGAVSDAYLFSNNQLAMIQTGHSTGQASDDERKVLANTLFYLKQLTQDTESLDRSAYDEAAPNTCIVGELCRENDIIQIPVEAQDNGTNYYYYIEAKPQGMAEEEFGRESEHREVCVTSGIAGYDVCITDSETPCAEETYVRMEAVEEGILSVPVEKDNENGGYLHIRAVDRAGNVGNELTVALPEKEEEVIWEKLSLHGQQDITIYCSTLQTGGEIYSGGNFTFGGSFLQVDNLLNASGRANLYTGNHMVKELQENVTLQEMPRLEQQILKWMKEPQVRENLYAYNSTHIAVPTFCQITTGAYCPLLTMDASLVCNGDINVGAGNVVLGETQSVAVYSRNGNININTSTLQGRGILYAPNGTVTINVSRMNFEGCIIAERIQIQGTEIVLAEQKAGE